MRLALLLACALSAASLTFADSPAGPKPGPVTQNAPAKVAALDKIAVIGASFSAGYGMDQNPNPYEESKLHLAHVIDASLLVPHQPVEDHATAFFFMDPKGTASRQLKKVTAAKPSAIVALDFLFWSGYGDRTAPDGSKLDAAAVETQRLADLDKTLASLAAFTCPILLGDFPDMTAATKVAVNPMLTPEMVPPPETLKKLNEHVAAFAKEHKNVVLVPLRDMTARLQGDEEIKVRGNTWPKGSVDKLMQQDHLHTTIDGTCAVWIMAVDTWLNAQKDLETAAIELDAAKLAAKVGEVRKAQATPAGAGAEKGAKKPVKAGG